MITIPLFLASLAFIAETVAAPSLVSLLIWILVFAIVVYLVFFILGHIPLPEPWRTVLTAIVALILLLILLRQFGLL